MARYHYANLGSTACRAAAGLRIARQITGAIFAVLVAAAVAPASAQDLDLARELNEQVVQVPVRPVGEHGAGQWALVASLYRPSGAGPFPIVILNHGSPGSAWERHSMGRYRPLPQIRAFTQRGFAVLVPMRRGYGVTGGEWAENYGTCVAPDYYRASREAAKDVVGSVLYAQSLPFVRRDQVLLVGQSAGGIAAIAAAAENPPGVIGVVNFSGGRGGRPYTNPGDPCVAANMTEAIGKLAHTIKVPVLWHYSENDQFFAPRHVKAWFKAFADAGAVGKLVMQPPFQWDGHGLFGAQRGLPIWTHAFDGFLKDLRFAAPRVPSMTPVADQGAPSLGPRPTRSPITTIPASGT